MDFGPVKISPRRPARWNPGCRPSMNEPATPPDLNRPDSATRYYRLNSLKLTYREYWNIVPSWQVIIPWIAKLLNCPMKFSTGLPHYKSVLEMRVSEAEVP